MGDGRRKSSAKEVEGYETENVIWMGDGFEEFYYLNNFVLEPSSPICFASNNKTEWIIIKFGASFHPFAIRILSPLLTMSDCVLLRLLQLLPLCEWVHPNDPQLNLIFHFRIFFILYSFYEALMFMAPNYTIQPSNARNFTTQVEVKCVCRGCEWLGGTQVLTLGHGSQLTWIL